MSDPRQVDGYLFAVQRWEKLSPEARLVYLWLRYDPDWHAHDAGTGLDPHDAEAALNELVWFGFVVVVPYIVDGVECVGYRFPVGWQLPLPGALG